LDHRPVGRVVKTRRQTGRAPPPLPSEVGPLKSSLGVWRSRDVNKAGSFKANTKAKSLKSKAKSLKAKAKPRSEVSRLRPRPEIKAKVEFNSYGL